MPALGEKQMSAMKKTLLLIGFVSGFFALGAPAFAEEYEVTELGLLPGTKRVAEAGDDSLVSPEFGNAGDDTLKW
jgi:hypothetical protein